MKAMSEMLPASVEEGTLWPKAMAGVVRPVRVPTTLRWLAPALPLLIQGGERFLELMSPCIAGGHYPSRGRNQIPHRLAKGSGFIRWLRNLFGITMRADTIYFVLGFMVVFLCTA